MRFAFHPCCFRVAHPAGDPGVRNRPAAAAGPVIGIVVFTTHRGERAEAILDREGRWRCPELPVLDRVLNALFEPRNGATAVRPFGHIELDRVAAWLKGKVQENPIETEFPWDG